MKNLWLVTAILIFGVLGLVAPKAARAEDEPAPGVARISLIHGDVSTQRGDSGDWVATTVNAPVVRGDKVATGARSRTEVELDYADIMRLDQRSEAKIADLSRTRIQVQFAQGTMNFTVFKDSEADVEIDTPNMAFHPLGEGSYRIQVNSSSETEVTVHNGQAEVSTPQGSTTVEKGQLITIQGTDKPQYQVAKARPRDEWDEWNKERDRVIRDAQSWGHTNRYYTGSHDLDRYGHWTYVPDYDWCWTPYEDAGWVPYRDGRWVWEPYYGWTWVSYEPWGWAPYHYGRWLSYGGDWCWWPGFVTPFFRPVFAPAFVSFIGFGFGRHHFFFGFGFGFSSIGWCPLGPFDPFFPWWGFGNSFNVVNITNITNIRNVTNVTNVSNVQTGIGAAAARGRVNGSNLAGALNDPRVRRAITTASADDFMHGRVSRNQQPVTAGALRQGQVVQGTLPAVPTRASLQPVDRPVNRNAIPTRANGADNFFSRHQPPAGPRSFNEHAAEIQRMVQKQNPLAGANRGSAIATGNASTGNATAIGNSQVGQRVQAGTPSIDLQGWRRFGPNGSKGSPQIGSGTTTRGNAGEVTRRAPAESPEQTRTQPAPGVQSPEDRQGPGWHRFGEGNSRPRTGSQGNGDNRVRPAPGPSRVPAPRESPPGPQARPAPKGERSNWQRFSGSSERGTRESAPPASNSQPRPAPSVQREETRGRSNWRQFTPQPAPAEREQRFSAPRSEGWNSPAPRERTYEAPRYESPRSYERPPLELRKPIVTERAPAPRSYQSGGAPRGGWGGGAPRGSWGGGGGGGGQRSAPAPSSSSGNSGKRNK